MVLTLATWARQGNRVHSEIDAQAARAYHQRLCELRVDREEAERANDLGRLAAIDGQVAQIRRELRQSRIEPTMNRLRNRIGNALRRRLAHIATENEALGTHLSGAIKHCHGDWWYQPRPE
jgi:hypothetical protein